MALHTETLVIKQPDAFVSNGDGSVPDSEESAVDTQAQPGVQNIEAVTVAWTKTALIVAYVMLWLIYFVEGTLSGTNAALNPYVTSDFAQHSLTPTVGILSSVIGGVTDLTLAKILDVFGRPQGYFLCIVIATVGLVMMAACNNVEAYAAAQVFYTVGNNGIHQRTPWESLVYYLREFDAAGLILLSAGVALFLLPFNLYTLQEKGWRAPLIICLLVFGILLIVLFALWERFLAPVTFIPYALLLDRTVFGACILSNALFLSYFCWNSFFSSFLQVVVDLSISEASYVIQAYTVGTCLSAIGVGLLVRNTGRYKPVCLYFGIPLSILGLGLMINFRRPGVNVGYLVMCQIFMAFAAGTIIICDEIAIMAAASHQHIAIVIAILGVFSSIGGAIGLTVAAAIWQDVFPKKLAEYLPPEELPNLPLIYADIVTQLSYAVGSPTRLAIQYAYGDAQKMLLVVGTAVWFIGLLAVVMWRDINVSNIKQVKGTAF
ncbi:putative Siderophore iron transporter mirB [Glarea lozoyensis 74030]|uniref:Putative Siderophore iron transporter mirB n=1 Tax=Glarea lozoyensis (strain ATCC 74030 / MF5533) TaxID=1104152 RepID=H0EYW3_GLAL7|nr:putative Siderophore iron transporter mirB [Glarea lozoyensis 74030]